MASYITFSLDEKIIRLRELEQRQSLGPVKSNQSGGGIRTEFDTKDINIEQEIKKLIESIRSDPGFDSTHPFWNAIIGSQRGGITEVVFN